MKRFLSLAIVIAVLLSYACQQDTFTDSPGTQRSEHATSEENAPDEYYTQGTFKARIGKPINRETGDRWIDNYRKVSGHATPPFVAGINTITDILKDPSCVGISFHYGQDNDGKVIILPIGVDGNGRLIKSDQVITQTGAISWETAQQWTGQYTGPVKSHFFGSDTFSRLLSKNTSDSIYLTVALDDSHNPQLLLRKPGKDINDKDDDDYEDGSWPCPPVCPK